MRCQACNCRLTEQESGYKDAITGEYLDLCKHCIGLADDLHYTDGFAFTDLDDDPEGREESEDGN